jgi:hypothetical protein
MLSIAFLFGGATAVDAKASTTYDPFNLIVTVPSDESIAVWLVTQDTTWKGGSYSSGKWAIIANHLVLDVSCSNDGPFDVAPALYSPIVTPYEPGCIGTLYDIRNGTVYATAVTS